ncbi:hypothetical protein BJY52DRAFT_1328619, partial [Lactarius psammicola]
ATHDTLIIDAWIVLVGTLSPLTTNVVFICVLVRFSIFLRQVKAEGAAPDVSLHFTRSIFVSLVPFLFP